MENNAPATTMGKESGDASAPTPVAGQQAAAAAPSQPGTETQSAEGSSGPGKKKKFLGRNEYRRQTVDKRKRMNEEWGSKRRKVNDKGEPIDWREQIEPDARKANPFSAEEIASESRRPKKKVAVMVGYSGTGYKGMQINWEEKTIEGDIFKAFIAAGAISKANADDPKKSSLARCARTDKGVHAAGNVISLKLIVEDEDIVDKINAHLPEQIRVWGIERTANSFSCYTLCDSRWYEYLLPSYCLLPAHPESFMGRRLEEMAKESGNYDEYKARFADVEGFWEGVEEKSIKPILEKLEPHVRSEVLKKIHVLEGTSDIDDTKAEPSAPAAADNTEPAQEKEAAQKEEAAQREETAEQASGATATKGREPTAVDFALRDIKDAYVKAKRDYRVSPARLEMLQTVLSQYEGTKNYHNYTVQKNFKDPSSKRQIKSFQVNKTPIQIRDTQWVSLKVHGQSFMMHQIRKMVSMAVLVVRSGTPVERVRQSTGNVRIAIPKMPGLGLLLERPVFEMYNRKAVDTLGRDPIDFDKYEEKMNAFKEKEIYQRIFELEEQENTFHTFFQQIDNFKSERFLWLSAGGIEAGVIQPASENNGQAAAAAPGEDDDDDEDPEGGEG